MLKCYFVHSALLGLLNFSNNSDDNALEKHTKAQFK